MFKRKPLILHPKVILTAKFQAFGKFREIGKLVISLFY